MPRTDMKGEIYRRCEQIHKMLVENGAMSQKQIANKFCDKPEVDGYNAYMRKLHRIRHCLKIMIKTKQVVIDESQDATRGPFTKKKVYRAVK